MSKPELPRATGRTDKPSANGRAVERHPCRLKAQWRCLGSQEDNLHTAEVSDVSHNGVALVINSRLERGQVLLVTLEGVPERLARAFLVRVRRATARPSGNWLIGCTWVTKLDEEAIQALRESTSAVQPSGTDEPSSAGSGASSVPDRRPSPRRRGASVAVMVVRLNDPSEKVEGWVLDRSLGGLGLSIPRPFQTGTVLELCPTHAPPGLRWVRVRVKHCSPLGKRWRLGCQFMGTPTSEMLLLFG